MIEKISMDEGNQTPGQFYDLPSNQKGSQKSPFLILVVIMIIGILLFAGYSVLKSRGKKETTTVVPNHTPTPTLTATPTPTINPSVTIKITPTTKASPTISKNTTGGATNNDRSTITVEILNGSGAPGAANKAKTILTGLGYKVVNTGNADSFNYEKTVIQVKSTKSNLLPLLKKDLSSTYTIGDASSSLANSTAGARIIIGKQ